MSAPFGHFRPGEAGFVPPAPRRPRSVLPFAASAWLVAILVAAILLVGLLVRLTRDPRAAAPGVPQVAGARP